MTEPRPTTAIISLARLQRDRAIAHGDVLAAEREFLIARGETATRNDS